jgi:hypothetical protein
MLTGVLDGVFAQVLQLVLLFDFFLVLELRRHWRLAVRLRYVGACGHDGRMLRKMVRSVDSKDSG